MKSIHIKVIALYITSALVFTGCLVIFNPSWQPMVNHAGEALFESPDMPAPQPEYRGTRAGPDWPMHRGDLPHSGYSTVSAPSNNAVLWTNTTGSGDGYGSPSIAAGKVFVGSADGYLYCFNLNTGVRLWRTFLSSADFGVMSTPAVANDHVIVFVSGTDALYRLRVSDGVINWTYDPGGGAYGSSSPAIYNGRVYFGSGSGYFYCVDEISGSLIWSYQGGVGPIRPYGIQSSPAVANGRIYVGSCDTFLYCFEEFQPTAPAGQYLWRTGLNDAIFGSPAVANGRVYCGSGYYVYSEGSNSHTMYCLDELTGSIIWSYTTGSDILSTPAIAYGYCYFTSTDGNLYCIDANHPGPSSPSLIWSKPVTDTWGSPSVADGKVVVGARGNNTIGCFNAYTGVRIWYYNAGNDIYSSPAIADGRVVFYVRGFPESLICFGSSVVYTVDYIEIMSQPSGGGIPIPTQTVGVGTDITGHAAAYNNTWGYLYDIQVDWSVGNGGGANATTSPQTMVTSSTFDSGYNGGTATWTADDGSGHTDTIFFTIDPPTRDYIEIVDIPNTGALQIVDQPVPGGFSIQGYAAGFNNTIGYLGDVVVNWNVTNLSGAKAYTVPPSGTSSTFYANFSGGIGVWTADDGAGHLDSVSFTISDPTMDYIEIVDTPGTGSSTIDDQTVNVGFSIQGYAAGFNNSFGYLGDVGVTWTVTNLSGAEAYTIPPTGTGSTFHANFSGGIGIWTADDGAGLVDTVTFTINPPAVDYIEIVDTAGAGSAEITGQTVDVGFSIFGYAASFNDTFGYIGDISVSWYVVNTGGAAGYTSPTSGTGSTLNAGFSGGTVEWWADDGSGHLDSVIYAVNPPDIDYIVIMSGPNGTGSWVAKTTYVYGQIDTFYAAGFNNTAGWARDVDVTWITDNSTVGDVLPGPSTSTTFTALNNGTCNITAEYTINPALTNTTGVITVIYFTVEYIIIRNAPGNGGEPVDDMFFSVGDTAVFYAAAYNSSAPGNYIGDVAVKWSVSNISLANVTTPGVSTLFSTLFTGGVCNVTAIYGSVLEDVTGDLTITSATLDYIIITETEGGPEVVDVILNIGESIWLYASGYNASGPTYTGPVMVEWSQSPSVIGSFGSSPGQSTVFNAGSVGGNTTVWAIYDPSGLALADNFTLTVIDAGVDYILIRDASDGGGDVVTTRTYMELDTDTFYAAAYNHTAGYLFDADVAWSCNDTSVGQVSTPGTSTTFSARDVGAEGTCRVSASYNAQIGHQTGTLTVLPINVDYIQIRDAPGGGGNVVDTGIYAVLDTDEFYAAAYSHLMGYLYDANVSWESDDTDAGHVTSPGTSTTLSAQMVDANTTFSITARYSVSVFNSTGPLTVLVPKVDYIQIRDAEDNVTQSIELELGQWAELHAVGFNLTAGYMGYVTVTWVVLHSIIAPGSVSGNLTNVTAHAPGTTTLYATYNLYVSNSTQFTVTTRISPPTGIEVSQRPQGGALNISWNENSEATLAGYNLYISLSSTGPFTRINTALITVNRFVDDGLTNGIRYYYYIEAVDADGALSLPSEIASGIPDRDTDGDGVYDFIDDDDDNDGLPDASEAMVGTNPLISDSDGDGVIDGEDYFPTDPEQWERPDEDEEPSPLGILIPVIILVVLVLLIFLMTRKREEPEPEQQAGSGYHELPPPDDMEPPEPDEDELPPPDEDELPPPEDEYLTPPPDDEDLQPPMDGEELPVRPEEELPVKEGVLPPPAEEEPRSKPPEAGSMPPPPPWLKKESKPEPLEGDGPTPPPHEEKSPPPPEEEVPSPADGDMPPPPPWLKKKQEPEPFDEDALPPPDD